MKLKVDNDYKSLLPELTAEQYTDLEKDIVKHGVLSPIITWNGTIIDGHNRYSICCSHHIEKYPTTEMKFASKADAMQWIISHQLARRNLKKSDLVKAYERYEAERAKEAKTRTGGRPKKEEGKLTSNLMQVSEGKQRNPTVAAEVAAEIGVSENTYRDMKLITNEGTPEQIKRMNNGGKGNGVSAIANEIRNKDVPEGMKKCSKCEKILPVSEFYKLGNGRPYARCKKCWAEKNKSRKRDKDIHGNRIEVPNEYKSISNQTIADGLADNEDLRTGIDDVVNEFMASFRSYLDNLVTVLNAHRDVIDGNKNAIAKMWEEADSEFQGIRRRYSDV